MSGSDLSQPHDSLVRYTFGSPENAASLLREHLPPRLVQAVDWSRLRIENGSYISEELRSSTSDLLYRLPFTDEGGRELYLYVLFEHQRTDDGWMPLRLLGYKKAIWDRFRSEHPKAKKLPPLVSLVLAQVDGGWRTSQRFIDLIDIPESLRPFLEPHLPTFEHLLIDLATISQENIKGNAAVRLALGVLKAAAEREFLRWAEWGFVLLRQIDSPEFLRALFRYVLNADSGFNLKKLVEKVRSNQSTKAGEAIMSIAEEVRAEGRVEGRLEGRLQGRAIGKVQTLQNLLGREEQPSEALAQLSSEDIAQLIAELEREVRQRLIK